MAADLQGNVILVTGGAQGIGAATAKLCAARGARVIIADFKNDGEQRAAEIRAEGGTADFLQTDVRNEAEVAELFEFTLGCHGRLDKLVCAAGVLPGPWQSPEDMPTEDFRRALDVNITGVFLCAKYATPLLEASGRGVFVVIGSGAGVFGPSSSLAYASGKGGVNGLAMTLQAQLGERGIRVNTSTPATSSPRSSSAWISPPPGATAARSRMRTIMRAPTTACPRASRRSSPSSSATRRTICAAASARVERAPASADNPNQETRGNVK